MRTYEECEKYILDIPKFAAKNELADTYRILEKLVDIDSLPHIIHVAGTNGKGSVCAFLRSILTEAGYHVGFFISPHLVDMTERIAIDYEDISREDFVRIFDKVKSCADHMIECGEAHHPSFFEFIFLMAMTYYCEQKTDYIILETGLGGRLDATNCIKGVEKTCVITEIGFDHMQYLGNTIEEIASKKCGIIKPGRPVITISQKSEVMGVIENYCSKQGSELVVADANKISRHKYNVSKQSFSYEGDKYEISLAGTWQSENAVLAINTVNVLRDAYDFNKITEKSIKNGLIKTVWPARFQMISKKPLFIAVFVGLSAGALGISVLTMWGCQEFCKAVLNLDISIYQLNLILILLQLCL